MMQSARATKVSLPVKIDTNDQPMATDFLQTTIATFLLLYLMPEISDPEIIKEHIYCYLTELHI